MHIIRDEKDVVFRENVQGVLMMMILIDCKSRLHEKYVFEIRTYNCANEIDHQLGLIVISLSVLLDTRLMILAPR